MQYRDIFTKQTIDKIDLININKEFQYYMITTAFNMTTHKPDYIESCIINNIQNALKGGSSESYLLSQYKSLRDHRYRVNTARNRNIYESHITSKRLDFIWLNYDIFYRHLISHLVNNGTRKSKRRFHPSTFDCIDVNGSKFFAPVVDDDGTLHIHSIYLIRNEISDRLDSLIEQHFMPILSHHNLTGIRAVHGKPIGSEPGKLRKVINYNSKFMTSHYARYNLADMSLYSQYPITDEERRQRRRDAQRLQADRTSR